jgi:hypothetical protein
MLFEAPQINDYISDFNKNLSKLEQSKIDENDDWNNFNDLLMDVNPTLLTLKKQNIDNSKKIKLIEDDSKLEVKLNIVNVKKDYKKCPKCDIYGKINDNVIICELCGERRPWQINEKYSISIEQNYNTSSNSFMVFNIIGKNSYCYQRSFLKTCANYSSFRNNNNKKEIINKIYQYSGNKIPINICNLTAELFDQIKQKNMYIEVTVNGVLLAHVCFMHAS